jgi:hypothetical protein
LLTDDLVARGRRELGSPGKDSEVDGEDWRDLFEAEEATALVNKVSSGNFRLSGIFGHGEH